MRYLCTVLLSLFLLMPAAAQVERANNASLLLRSASFGATMETAITYQLSEYEPGHWVAQAQYAEPSAVNWMVVSAPMGGPNAGYIVFVNGENEMMTLDVLTIDECYGTTGEIRIGW